MPLKTSVTKANEQGAWGVFLLIYGHAGTGKTPLAANAQDSEYGKNVLFLGMESGTRSISHRSDINVAKITNFDEYKAVKDDIFINYKDAGYRTYAIDNGSELANMSLRKAAGNLALPQLQHYGIMTAQMQSEIRDWRDFADRSHCNVIFIAWDVPEKDESTGVIKYPIGFTDKLASRIPGMVDVIGYLEIEKGWRKLTFEANEHNDAKFRRPPTVEALKIPGTLYWKDVNNLPMADILNTLIGDKPFPVEKYRRTS